MKELIIGEMEISGSLDPDDEVEIVIEDSNHMDVSIYIGREDAILLVEHIEELFKI